jgi:hypothetical protein
VIGLDWIGREGLAFRAGWFGYGCCEYVPMGSRALAASTLLGGREAQRASHTRPAHIRGEATSGNKTDLEKWKMTAWN